MPSIDTSEVHALAADLRAGADQVEPLARRIMGKTGFDVVATGQQLSPYEFGVLEESIGVDFTADGLGFEAGPTVEYGLYQELGTSEMAAQPFMGPAFDRHEPRAVKAFGQIADRAL